MEKHLFIPLSIKIIVIVAISSLIMLAMFSQLLIKRQEQCMFDLVYTSANRIAETIRLTTYYDMLLDRRDSVYRMMDTLGQLPGILKIRIYNKTGKITYSSLKKEVGFVVNKESEACYNCHRRNKPLTKLNTRQKFRIFHQENAGKVLGLIQPIYNEKSCYSASCHAHPKAKQLLGVVDIQMSLKGVDETVRRNKRYILLFTLIFTLVIPTMAGFLIYKFIHSPVKKLTHATSKIATGELDVRIEINSNDELGILANSFNEMAMKLKKAHEELTDWADTLEYRIKEKTRQLQKAQGQIIQSEKMASLGRLAAVVAHEINNPIAGILTYTKLIKKIMARGKVPENKIDNIKQYLDVMESETARCGRIVKGLLAFARGSNFPTEIVKINDVIKSVLNILAYKFSVQQVQIKEELSPNVPPIKGNSDQIQQAVMCLTHNACDAMPDGGTLTVKSIFNPENNMVEIIIKDTGEGIPENIRNSLFEPFVSTKTTEGCNGENLGLGLFVTYGIIQRHGGTIAFKTETGKGTEFIISLPLEYVAENKGNDKIESI